MDQDNRQPEGFQPPPHEITIVAGQGEVVELTDFNTPEELKDYEQALREASRAVVYFARGNRYA